jgi:hypothetical protein
LSTYKVLVLSLEKDKERRKQTNAILFNLGLGFKYFDAITPDKLSYYQKEIYFKDLDHNPKVDREAVMATFISHLEILKIIFKSKTNTLLLEDDLIPARDFDFKNVDFDTFGVKQLMSEVSCCCQFYNWKEAGEIFWHLTSIFPTQAFDWELHKLRSKFNIQTVDKPIFTQSTQFVSNIAPNGY